MKNRTWLISLVLLLCLTLPLQSFALVNYYENIPGGAPYEEADLPYIQGHLTSSMPTRTGPGTKYEEPGTFYEAGDYVQIISLAYDDSGVAWVQVEVEDYRGRKYRAYTGLKRFDNVTASEIPLEVSGIAGTITQEAPLYYGPGWDYEQYNWTLSAGRTVEMIASENGFYLVDYASVSGEDYHFWIHASYIY